jgi:hypothetical protein
VVNTFPVELHEGIAVAEVAGTDKAFLAFQKLRLGLRLPLIEEGLEQGNKQSTQFRGIPDRPAAKALQDGLKTVSWHGTTVYELPFGLPPEKAFAQGRTGLIRKSG